MESIQRFFIELADPFWPYFLEPPLGQQPPRAARMHLAWIMRLLIICLLAPFTKDRVRTNAPVRNFALFLFACLGTAERDSFYHSGGIVGG